ncbi:MAG: double-strand break repair helicase AddA [Rhodobacteraceae bacterium]|nr:double-strand break repair helicase AddA [Paracoccaceae bacterium]
MIRRDAATEMQVRAATPLASTWLAANAGSGKTRVLTDRVARLLLRGTNPQRILCLTYTKAAASEMQNRLFQRLGEWAMLPDDKLADALLKLGEDQGLTQDILARARTLFARAIETPGGLKIQTIHSFCAALLRRFPLEAGVSPKFAEMAERASDLLGAEILDEMADGTDRPLIDGVAKYLSNQRDVEALLAAVKQGSTKFQIPRNRTDFARLFGANPGRAIDDICADVFTPSTFALLDRCVSKMRNGSPTDVKNADRLARVTDPTLTGLIGLETVLLTGSGAKARFTAKIDVLPTRILRNGTMAEDMAELNALMDRVETARSQRIAMDAMEKSDALHAFAQRFLAIYAERKQQRGWLDFDDLTQKARKLLNDQTVASWVLYRLDGGIDHILVDEAQDTSPDQWNVIEKLSQEFTRQESARGDIQRTIFVVGDKKQSIYSFQGAAPDAFDQMRAEFGTRLRKAGQNLQDLTLDFSFRSAPEILSIVDHIFAGQAEAGFTDDGQHRAFKSNLPGRVDLWPVTPKSDDAADTDWFDPVDLRSERHHYVVLADQVARNIHDMIQSGATVPVPVEGAEPGTFARSPVSEGDFLILVQRRNKLFAEIIRACKSRGLQIAGADRLKAGTELAVKDLAATISFLATPEDSLSLACTLKSPIFGWTEQDLFSLAHHRKADHLWTALREKRDLYPNTMAILDDLRNMSDFLRPYDLIERILTRHRGRQKLRARLGPEAEDGINALLSQALVYERSDVPSLTGFIAWMQSDDLEIKRQIGAASNQIRVMTVHGAKGLEAPIIILPDTGPRRDPPGDDILDIDGIPVWKMSKKDDMPDAMREAYEAQIARQQHERQRLLYVALTRAEKWLIVAAAGELSKSGDSWYQQVQAALDTVGAVPHDFGHGTGLRYEHPAWSRLPVVRRHVSADDTPQMPAEMYYSPPPSSVRETSLSPSDLGGAKVVAGKNGRDADTAMDRGIAVHRLLEKLPTLPVPNRSAAATYILRDYTGPDAEDILREATKIINTPTLGPLFGPHTLSEVTMTARIGKHQMTGIADRVIVTADMVAVVDFKTNATVPKTASEVPDGILSQMGAYHTALAQIYPGREIALAILWTRTATLMLLSADLALDALARAPGLDTDLTGS